MAHTDHHWESVNQPFLNNLTCMHTWCSAPCVTVRRRQPCHHGLKLKLPHLLRDGSYPPCVLRNLVREHKGLRTRPDQRLRARPDRPASQHQRDRTAGTGAGAAVFVRFSVSLVSADTPVVHVAAASADAAGVCCIRPSRPGGRARTRAGRRRPSEGPRTELWRVRHRPQGWRRCLWLPLQHQLLRR